MPVTEPQKINKPEEVAKEKQEAKQFSTKKELPITLNDKQISICKFIAKGNPVETTRKEFSYKTLQSLRSNCLNKIYPLFEEFANISDNAHSKYPQFQYILKNYNLDN